jgi:hypothetical protein
MNGIQVAITIQNIVTELCNFNLYPDHDKHIVMNGIQVAIGMAEYIAELKKLSQVFN